MEHIVELMEDKTTEHFVAARDCVVERKTNDTVKWTNPTHTDYTIHFDECPFLLNDFTVPAMGMKGPIALRPKIAAKNYAYEIQPPKAMASTVMAADPNVIVR